MLIQSFTRTWFYRLFAFSHTSYAYLDHLFQKKKILKAYGYLVGEGSSAHLHHMFWQNFQGLKLA